MFRYHEKGFISDPKKVPVGYRKSEKTILAAKIVGSVGHQWSSNHSSNSAVQQSRPGSVYHHLPGFVAAFAVRDDKKRRGHIPGSYVKMLIFFYYDSASNLIK